MKVYRIEATDMGSDQEEIAAKVEELVREIEFASDDEFHELEEELVTRACKKLGWSSVPQQGGLAVEWEKPYKEMYGE